MPFVACREAPKPPVQRAKTIAATVITVRTTIQPGDRVTNHEIVIAGSRARSTEERDVWRMFDTKANTVTVVDDVARTTRTDSIKELVKTRRVTLSNALPPHYPRGTIERGNARAILGRNATQHLIEVGGYRRELWIAEHPAVPGELFAMMCASDPPSSPLGPMMRDVDAALIDVSGFPLVDRSEVALEKNRYIVERTVTSIASRQVPEAMLEIPRGYRDVTPKPPPAK